MISNELTEHLELLTTTYTARSTSGRGSSNKLELTGIKKLRELILELAVRGRLVPQNPEDEPAPKLLERIEAEKERLIKEKQIKKQKALPPIADDEKPFELPEGWDWARFGTVVKIMFTGLDRGKAQQGEERSTPYFKMNNINNDGGVNLQSLTNVDVTDEELEKFKLSGGDFLFNTRNSRDLVGKTAVFGSYQEPIIFNNNILKVRFFELVPAYVDFWFRAISGKQVLEGKKSNTTNVCAIYQGKLLELQCPVAPLEEQYRIVAKADELMALCDQLEQEETDSIAAHQTLVDAMLTTLTDSKNACELAENWSLVAEHFDTLFTTEASITRLRQTILQLAVMGKLVPQDPNDEPAAKLLERITTEKAQLVKEGKIKKQKPLPPITEDDKPFELPKDWEWCHFGSMFYDLKYGTSRKSDYGVDGVPILRIPNVVDGYISVDDLKFADLSIQEVKDLKLSKGDLLFIRSNGSLGIVGRCTCVDRDLDNFAYAGYLVRARISPENANSMYLELVMRTGLVRDQIEKPIRTTSGVKNINSTEIGNLLFPLPPLEEQHRIIAQVNELMTLCDTLQQQVQQAQSTQQLLASALVEQAIITHNQPAETNKVA